MTNTVVYIAGDGSGHFNCDGKDDHIEINKALQYQIDNPEVTTVYLKGPFRYIINDSLLIGNNVTLTGDSNAVLTVDTAGLWEAKKPMIKQKLAKPGKIIVKGFEIDGQADTLNKKFAASLGKKELRGDGYYNMMLLYFGTVEVCNMHLHNSLNDGVKVKYADVWFHDNKVYKLGHEALYALRCKSVISENNNVRTKTNTGTRIQDSNHVKIRNNTIWTEFEPDAGGPGIQIQFSKSSSCPAMNDIEVYNNLIYDTYGPGIWLIALGGTSYKKADACNVYIHDNTFKGCGTHPSYNWAGGIVTSGFYNTIIENNVFDGCYNAGIVYMYPNDSRFSGMAPKGTDRPFTTIVKNNTICNTVLRKGTCGGTVMSDPKDTGQGIADYYPATHKFACENNILFGNVGGNYFNAGSTTDTYDAVQFVGASNHGSTIVEGKMSSCDNRMKESTPNTVYEKPTFLDVGKLRTSKYRSLIYFDLSEHTTEIGKSVLSLSWYYPANSRTKDTVVEIYRPASTWNTKYISWTNRDSGTKWSNAGGDWFDKDGLAQGIRPYATLTFEGSTVPDNKYYEFDVTELVNEYISGKYENTGFLIKAKMEDSNYIAFYSLNHGENKPLLTITAKPEEPKPAVVISCESTDKLKELVNNVLSSGFATKEQMTFENVPKGWGN